METDEEDVDHEWRMIVRSNRIGSNYTPSFDLVFPLLRFHHSPTTAYILLPVVTEQLAKRKLKMMTILDGPSHWTVWI